MSMVFAGQLGYQAYNLVFNSAFDLDPFVALRLASRNLGLMAVYSLFAYHVDVKQKKRNNINNAGPTKTATVVSEPNTSGKDNATNKTNQSNVAHASGKKNATHKNNKSNMANASNKNNATNKNDQSNVTNASGKSNAVNKNNQSSVAFHLIGHFLLAAFFGCFAFLLKYEKKERAAFLLHIVGSSEDEGGSAVEDHFLLEACFWVCIVLAGIFLSRKLVTFSFKAGIIILALYTFYIDADVGFWTQYPPSTSSASGGVPIWMQIRLISDNMAILSALLLFDIYASKVKTD